MNTSSRARSMAANKRSQEAGVDFTLVVGDETGWPVRRLLEVTGLGTQLVIVE